MCAQTQLVNCQLDLQRRFNVLHIYKPFSYDEIKAGNRFLVFVLITVGIGTFGAFNDAEVVDVTRDAIRFVGISTTRFALSALTRITLKT